MLNISYQLSSQLEMEGRGIETLKLVQQWLKLEMHILPVSALPACEIVNGAVTSIQSCIQCLQPNPMHLQ